MGEFDGIKVKPEDNPFAGLKVAPGGSRYPEPKSLSQSDQDLGLTSDAAKIRIQDVGLKRFLREVIAPSVTSEEDQAIARGDPEAIRKEGERVLGALGGLGVAGKVAKAAASAAPRAGLATYAEIMKSSIAKTAANGLRDATIHSLEKIPGLGPALGLAAGRTIDAVPAAARGAAAAARTVAPIAGAPAGAAAQKALSPEGEPKPYRGVWSNAVERLRASAGGNPRAQELLNRIDAIPDSGAGTDTVTQGTLGQ